MAIIKGKLRPEGTNNYADVIYLETSADQIMGQGLFGVTSGTNTYTVTMSNITSLYAGLRVTVKFANANTGASTLNVSGLGAKPIVKAGGIALSSGNLKANGVYTLVYDGANFQLQGEGASGNATASDLLSGKTATTDAGLITGTMPNRGAVNASIATEGGSYTIPAGYHSGSGKVTVTYKRNDSSLFDTIRTILNSCVGKTNTWFRAGIVNNQVVVFDVEGKSVIKKVFNLNGVLVSSTPMGVSTFSFNQFGQFMTPDGQYYRMETYNSEYRANRFDVNGTKLTAINTYIIPKGAYMYWVFRNGNYLYNHSSTLTMRNPAGTFLYNQPQGLSAPIGYKYISVGEENLILDIFNEMLKTGTYSYGGGDILSISHNLYGLVDSILLR